MLQYQIQVTVVETYTFSKQEFEEYNKFDAPGQRQGKMTLAQYATEVAAQKAKPDGAVRIEYSKVESWEDGIDPETGKPQRLAARRGIAHGR